jgi:hypothetical protein
MCANNSERQREREREGERETEREKERNGGGGYYSTHTLHMKSKHIQLAYAHKKAKRSGEAERSGEGVSGVSLD